MSLVLITGAVTGLGRGAATELLGSGHDIIVHARSRQRLDDSRDLLKAGARGVVGDLADAEAVRDLAAQVLALGVPDAVIHNAGTMDESLVLPVNVVAPYLLTTLLPGTRRHIYLSSSMHRSGRADLAGLETTWVGRSADGTSRGYSDSKLYVTVLMAAVARRCPQVLAHAVDPGWVPTRMGGTGAPDDLYLGHLTQSWLAVTDDARPSGGYWHHQRRQQAHPAVHDIAFQETLLAALEKATGTELSGCTG